MQFANMRLSFMPARSVEDIYASNDEHKKVSVSVVPAAGPFLLQIAMKKRET